MLAYRTCKVKYAPLDGTGAAERGGRWNSRGRPVVYAAVSYANTLLEILVHRDGIRLPGAHHVAQLDVPDGGVERLASESLPGWDAEASAAARAFGDRWLAERRSVALLVPAMVARPFELNVLVNPLHPDFARVLEIQRITVPCDARLAAGGLATP
ncbi:MAG TPA: RES domain-containing protein [Gemmatimonadales bacterium]|nr:RES domain-containing protein [Gemmatimonadales bacterium]